MFLISRRLRFGQHTRATPCITVSLDDITLLKYTVCTLPLFYVNRATPGRSFSRTRVEFEAGKLRKEKRNISRFCAIDPPSTTQLGHVKMLDSLHFIGKSSFIAQKKRIIMEHPRLQGATIFTGAF